MQWIQYFAPNVVQAYCHFVLGSWGFKDRTSTQVGTTPPKRPPGKLIVARGFFIFIMVNLLNVPIFVRLSHWLTNAEALKELEMAPVDKKCPLLWSDPAAN